MIYCCYLWITGYDTEKRTATVKGCATLFVSPRGSGKFFCYAFCQEKSGESTGVTQFVSFSAIPQLPMAKKKRKKLIKVERTLFLAVINRLPQRLVQVLVFLYLL